MNTARGTRANAVLGLVVALAGLAGCPTEDPSRDVGQDPDDATTGAGSAGETGGSVDSDGEDSASADGTGAGGTDVVRTELTGRARADAPWFRFVDNFNDDEAIEIAVDPIAIEALAGDTCDAYLVAARDEGGWAADATLVDVGSGPVAVQIGETLRQSRFEIAAAGSVSADAGAGLGVPYDVVLDCNENGQLDAGDVIDGGDRPGLYRTHDVAAPGPYEVALLEYSGGTWLGQRTFYPANIADLGEAPLVVVTHGWSYDYTHYDYIGRHLASYGYVVMHHETNVGQGGPAATLDAAENTLANTDYLLSNLDMIGGGVLAGHVDDTRIMCTGHSTGGEAVVAARTMLAQGTFGVQAFSIEDLRVVSSMAPVSWHPRGIVDPGETPYHMFVAGADDDVSGAPIPSYTQPRSIFERATGDRLLTYIHGAGHGDLVSCCGPAFVDTSAPGLIGRESGNVVARGTFLALAELYLRANAAAREHFARSFAEHHPPSTPAGVVVASEFHDARGGVYVFDDFESSGDAADPLAAASSGGAVTYELPNAVEVLMRDNDGSFAWIGDQPSNGMTHARHADDDPHALVFDFGPGASAFYELTVPDGAQDLTGHGALSLRACQGTRHPATVALGGPLSFAISLRDAAGEVAMVPVSGPDAIPAPYARTGEGTGVGWQNEFSSVRIRLADFAAANPALDLAAIVAIRLDFGEAFGSAQGRVGIDDLTLVPR